MENTKTYRWEDSCLGSYYIITREAENGSSKEVCVGRIFPPREEKGPMEVFFCPNDLGSLEKQKFMDILEAKDWIEGQWDMHEITTLLDDFDGPDMDELDAQLEKIRTELEDF